MKELPKYANALLPYFLDEQTIFIVSSDFCHWGERFDYVHQYPDETVIHKSIERLDREGMAKIESQSSAAFQSYLDETKNTICGRQPILLLLAILEAAKDA